MKRRSPRRRRGPKITLGRRSASWRSKRVPKRRKR